MLPRKFLKILLPLLATIFFVFGANSASAVKIDITYPKIPGAEAPQDFLKTASSADIVPLYIKYIFNFAVWISGILILSALLYAGIKFILSSGDPQKTLDAKKTAFSAFLGTLILLSAVIVFNIINPYLPIIDLSGLEKITPINYREVPSPPPLKYQSRIYTEIPFGTIIDKIFETEKNQRPDAKKAKTVPRLKRIELLTASTVKLAANLENQSGDIQKAAHKCKCENAEPVCGSGCSSGKSCDCDTCKNSRSEIEKNQRKNIDNIAELKKTQQAFKEEIRLLDADIGKLENAEKFMMECNLKNLQSLSKNLENKKYLEDKGFLQPTNKYWKNIFIDNDFGTFYCPVSGSLIGAEAEAGPTPTEPLQIGAVSTGKDEDIPPFAKEGQIGRMPVCSTEVPVGEIIDRTEKLGHRLSERMTTIVLTNQQLIEAVEKLQISVSECTSQNPRCRSVCRQTISGCKKIRCEGETCKFDEIDKNFDEVKKIKKELVDNIVNNQDPSNIGIYSIIKNLAAQIINELEAGVREPMQKCARYIPIGEGIGEQEVNLRTYNCMLAYGLQGPGNIMIENCCARKSEYQEGELGAAPQIVQDIFRQCQQQCYAWTNYNQCFAECIAEKGKNLDRDNLKRLENCRPSDNYFCCNI